MPISQVCFTSRLRAEALVANPHTAVISITDPGTPEAALSDGFRDILRLAFFDAVPADEYLPAPMPGLFDHRMARQIGAFVSRQHAAAENVSVVVHCEYGVSRSAAVALFVEAYSSAPLIAREFAYDANHWVVDQLSRLYPDLYIEIPSVTEAEERRSIFRPPSTPLEKGENIVGA
jgi:predicted protein tyrosine phosphatase